MSVRVVARIRPLLEKEIEKDIIVHADGGEDGRPHNVVRIPNPKNYSEEFSFTFNGVYDMSTSQETLFTAEIAPHVKSLFQGLDVTIFAYGVTGTGKTHTMRGGLKLAERGVIPRLLSAIFRRGKKIAKDTEGETSVEVALSYYEIYNDKVYDLLEPPEKRTPTGLPLREKDNRTQVVGLSERSCVDLKDFEKLYIEANNNRVTAATKLNAHSSRSHAILRVKVTQTSATEGTVRESTASAIDLAGSEDNRRTDNGKERLVESAAINKSLFVLAKCVDAIGNGSKRIPYRESKMTRILSLGQNNGITVMILNLAPLKSYHLDTLSSLNVSSRAKRIEVREIENEVVYKQCPRTNSGLSGTGLARQPLKLLANSHNVAAGAAAAAKAQAEADADKPPEKEKPAKAFAVYQSPVKASKPTSLPTALAARPVNTTNVANTSIPRSPIKRKPGAAELSLPRPSKIVRPSQLPSRPPAVAFPPPSAVHSITAEQIEAMVERKVQEVLAARAAAEAEQAPPAAADPAPQPVGNEISEAVQKRLDELERRIQDSSSGRAGGGDESRSEGLRFLLQARQLKEHGDDEGALRAYEAALPFFPGQAKLLGKINRLRAKLAAKSEGEAGSATAFSSAGRKSRGSPRKRSGRKAAAQSEVEADPDFDGGEADVDDDGDGDCGTALSSPGKHSKKASRKPRTRAGKMRTDDPEVGVEGDDERETPLTPRKKKLLEIVNSRDPVLIRGLAGFGAKKAKDLVDNLAVMGQSDGDGDAPSGAAVEIVSLAQLRTLPGMGGRTVDRAYEGLAATAITA
ncbi:kinesin-II 95 kDa subunit [Magnaporthiopsis poae ATCC 64411]|uniref:Kinesin-II 95 kDa subunit n=1 Tax=Magnaporthiopsis poae (strain ATCC 64411 / 73-15) TaxID=644358 RepID=A0A0C4DX28_MAGP6|nr:kinesin-II 95 kDa subunit [Magnaporthiopsis poae ATCC 64411]